MSDARLQQTYCINTVVVDPLKNQILRDGELISVSPKSIQILQYLVEKRGVTVSYDELNEAIWKGHCGERALYQQVANLRKALGDNPNHPTFISTIPKTGYCFIGSLSFPDGSASVFAKGDAAGRRQRIRGISLALIAVLLSGAGVYLFYDHLRQAPGDILVDLQKNLDYPERVVALEAYYDERTPHTDLLHVFGKMAKYHLERAAGQHVTLVPGFQDAAAYRSLAEHFSVFSRLEAILKPRVVSAGDGSLRIGLELIDPKDGRNRELFSMPVPRDGVAENLRAYEHGLIEQLQRLGLVRQEQGPLLNANIESSRLFAEAAKLPLYRFVNQARIEQSIDSAKKSIALNPGNMIAYSVIWDDIFSLLNYYSKYDAIAMLKEESERALALDPKYFKARHANADYYCWIENHKFCVDKLSATLALNRHDPVVLSTLRSNLEVFGENTLRVNWFNYQLNPFARDTILFVHGSLLNEGRFAEAIELINHHTQWRTVLPDWRTLGKRQTRYQDLRELADWYMRQRFGVAARDRLPTRYIGYMLLNANQPDLARYWAEHGKEEPLLYFDIKVIDLLADIWQGQWRDDKWRELRDFAMSRSKFQTIMDKLYIAYLDYYSNELHKAGSFLEQVFPAFAGDKPVALNQQNFRFYVYYREIQKYLFDSGKEMSIEHALRDYLQSMPALSERDVDFGIADAEFYALNNEKEKALAVLRQAILEQGWLPNAFWLWPPIEHNPSLRSLRDEPEFRKLSEEVRKRLNALCFKERCGM